MTTLDRPATLDPRALEEAADGIEGFTVPGVPAHVVASAAITAYLNATQPVVETVDGLEELQVGTVVVDGEERPAVRQADEENEWWLRAGSEHGWVSRELPLPARVIFSPGGTR